VYLVSTYAGTRSSPAVEYETRGRVCSTVVRAMETRITNLVAHILSLMTVGE
jgi:hypothetical protein